MFSLKKKYFLIVKSIKDIDLSNIKISNKFTVIYRNKKKIDDIHELIRFRKLCKLKKIDFYVSNNFKLAVASKADGIYISANNTSLNYIRFKNANFKLIGSAHNIREISTKILQGCSSIIFSRLFETRYAFKKGFLGTVKFNLLKNSCKERLIPLGGIRLSNLNKMKTVNCISFAILSELKKKPAVISRLF